MSSKALAPNAIGNTPLVAATNTLFVIFGIALIALSAKIQVPFWPVPMTLQTLAIAGIAAAYGFRLGLVTVIAYLAVGYMGAPVFAGPVAGPGYLMGPTAGFLAGFVILTAIVGYVADKTQSKNPFVLFGAMLVGDLILFTLGFVWLAYFFVTGSGATLGSDYAWTKGVSPYILGDIFKMALAAALVPAIGRLMKR